MGICTSRNFMLSICFLELLSTILRQVFDFLGFLWIPIFLNFVKIIFIIFGFFGAYQCRLKYVIAYSCCNVGWLGWNVFLMCLYLDIGILNHKSSKVLKLDPDSRSWWENGPGCKKTLDATAVNPPFENITNCLVDYRYVEIVQAALQCILAFLGIVTGLILSKLLAEEGDSSSHKILQNNSKRRSLYSIEFTPQMEGRALNNEGVEYDNDHLQQSMPPKPMTPRRVKRRSVMTRGSTNRQSLNSRRHSGARSSTRSSRRLAQNPVTKLLEQQQKVQSYDNCVTPSPTEPLPGYYHTNSNLLQQNWQNNGHTNPTYQQSSIQSLNEPDDLDDLYNIRPASVRSSYSNFHGTRVMNHSSPQKYNNHATPQVPQKRSSNPNRQSMRSMMFLNSGPPAYSSQIPTSADSETTI